MEPSEMTIPNIKEKVPGRVSVIVGAYNVADYLDRCLGSIVSQTYSDVEIIVVNDCSTDDTASVIGRYAVQDSRVRGVNLPRNVGCHAVRIEGLPYASGEFITFVDSDDWIDARMYAAMVSAALKDDADVVLCGARIVDSSGNVNGHKVRFRKRKVISSQVLEEFCDFGLGSGVMWNKLYRADLIRAHLGTRYERGPECPGDYDYLVNLGCFADASKVVVLPESYYWYFERTGSLSRQGESAREFAQNLRGYVTCLEAYANKFGEKSSLIDELYAVQLTMACYLVKEPKMLDEISPEITKTLQRLAVIRPQAVYALIHAFDTDRNGGRQSVRRAVRRLKADVRDVVVALATWAKLSSS
jgi:glycosyltransferase involved in cell wall biosynthesis